MSSYRILRQDVGLRPTQEYVKDGKAPMQFWSYVAARLWIEHIQRGGVSPSTRFTVVGTKH